MKLSKGSLLVLALVAAVGGGLAALPKRDKRKEPGKLSYEELVGMYERRHGRTG